MTNLATMELISGSVVIDSLPKQDMLHRVHKVSGSYKWFGGLEKYASCVPSSVLGLAHHGRLASDSTEHETEQHRTPKDTYRMLQGSQSDPLPEQTNCYKLLWTTSAWTGAFDQVLLGWALMSRMWPACTRWW